MTDTDHRVLLIGLDGFRPDLFDPDETPVLAGLLAGGTHFTDHRSVYPPHTQSAVASIATGCYPGQHGLMGNSVSVPGFNGGLPIDAGDDRELAALEAAGYSTLLVPALGDYLAKAGERVAIAGSGNAGATSFWSRADLSRAINVHSDYDRDDVRLLRDRLGPAPSKPGGSEAARTAYAARAVTEIFLQDSPGDRVIVLWLNEPDTSYHTFGIGSPESRAAMRDLDTAIGGVLDVLDRTGRRDQFDILVMSDHGQTTIASPASLADFIKQAEDALGKWVRSLFVVADGGYPAEGSRLPSLEQLDSLVDWLLDRPEVRAVFTVEIDGSIPKRAGLLSDLWNGKTNPRAPLLAIDPVVTSDTNEFGIPGTAQFSTIKTGMRTSHGSLSPFDMSAFLVANGPSFTAGALHHGTTSVVDILPTILDILGMPIPDHVDGRSLHHR